MTSKAKKEIEQMITIGRSLTRGRLDPELHAKISLFVTYLKKVIK